MQRTFVHHGLVCGIVFLLLAMSVPSSIKADREPQLGEKLNNHEKSSHDRFDEWPMYHHDLCHTGISGSTAPSSPYEVWTGNVHGWTESSPAVRDGKVFVTSEDSNIYCFDAYTGFQLWVFQTGDLIVNSPCVANGKVYFGSLDMKIYCLDENTGALIWSYSTNWVIAQSAPAVYQGNVYMGSQDGNFYCLNADNGSLVWFFNDTQWISSPPAIYQNRVYFGDWIGNIYGLNATTGSVEWLYDFGYTTYFAAPTIVDDRLYLGGMDFDMKCIDIPTCSLVWTVPTGYYVTSAPVVLDDRVIFCSWDSTIYCVGKQTGVIKWTYTTGGGVADSPAISLDGRMYIGSADGNLYCMDPLTGDVYWQYDLGGQATAPAIAYGRVYISSLNNGLVHCLGTPSDPPVANFSWTPAEPETNQTVSFDASSSYDPDGSIVLYEWDWNADGHYDESSATPYAHHAWKKPGNYSVGLRVTDNNSDKGTLSQTISIHAPPVPPDTTPPTVTIMTPLEGMCTVFFHGKQILQRPCSRTIVVGHVTVTVNASDTESGVGLVQVYLNGGLQANLTSSPYSWAWLARGGFHSYNLTVKAVDNAGNWNEDSMTVLKIF